MVSAMIRLALGVVIVAISTPGVTPQLLSNLNGVAYSSTPTYCTTIVTNYQTCPATMCYGSVFRSQCCMGLYRTTTGTLYQQCMCSNAINCSPAATAAPVVTAAPFSDTPLYCAANVLTPICGISDPCFNSTTRSSCCVAVQRPATNIMLTICRCNSNVQCPAVPVLP